VKVFLGIPTYDGQVHVETMKAVAELFDSTEIASICGNPSAASWNDLLTLFRQSGANVFVGCKPNVSWSAKTAMKLIEAAEAQDMPGLAAAIVPAEPLSLEAVRALPGEPQQAAAIHYDVGPLSRGSAPPGFLDVMWSGLGLWAISKDVFETLAATPIRNRLHGSAEYFRSGVVDGKLETAAQYFCRKLREACNGIFVLPASDVCLWLSGTTYLRSNYSALLMRSEALGRPTMEQIRKAAPGVPADVLEMATKMAGGGE
jgi:hypothetical protein